MSVQWQEIAQSGVKHCQKLKESAVQRQHLEIITVDDDENKCT